MLPGCSQLGDAVDPHAMVLTNDIDPSAKLSREDYIALRHRHPGTAQQDEEPPIPALPAQKVEKAAQLSALDKLVSLNVNDSVPVRDVLLELMQKTKANLEIDPRVQGGVIISANNQPFGQVLKRICDMAGLRYKIEGSFIRVEPDEAYQETYHLDYLSLSRKATSETGIATNVFDVNITSNSTSGTNSSSNSGSGVTTQNNSTAKVAGNSDADFWGETDKSLAQILSSNSRGDKDKASFSMDRQAGIVTVFANGKQQKAVESYFNQLRRKATSQVLIDARIVEVELDETYQSGIDWSGVIGNAFGFSANYGAAVAAGANGYFTTAVSSNNFSGLLNLVQTFGTTRVLSAPRVTVLNNQTAVMKVATNQVYFITSAQFTTTTNANGASVTTNPVFTSTPRTVPVGFVMTVQPAIDTQNGRVTMTLRPTISRVVGQVSDPSINLNAAVAGVSAGVQSQLPVLAVREMDSVIQLRSGEIAVLGGLMQDSSINQDQGIPGLSDMPYISSLFKSRDNNGKTSELLILLRATIAEQPKPDRADSALYSNYSSDPRPVPMPKPKAKAPVTDTTDDLDDWED